jgi:hypothetical protein
VVTLRLGTFTRSLLLAAARRNGRLGEADLVVDEISVTSSKAQFDDLDRGALDAVITGPDNVLAYHFLSDNPLARPVPSRIWCAVDRGLDLSLWLAPGAALEAVRGGRLGVDVAGSGFAFIAYDLLARRGIRADQYEIVGLGSTPGRVGALVEGRCEVTILNAGNELRAEALGAARVGSVGEIGPYLGTVLATRANPPAPLALAVGRLRDVLLTTAREIVAGVGLDDLASDAEALLGLAPDLARQHVQSLAISSTGFVTDGVVDRGSFETLVALRAEHRPTPELALVGPGLGEVVDGDYLAD